MKRQTHILYGFLMIISIVIIVCSFLVQRPEWNTIMVSIGCGGIASVVVAWLIDYQNHRNKKAENQKKYESILRQYVKLFRRLLWHVANECYGLYHDYDMRSLQEWLSILSDESRYNACNEFSDIQRRCKRLSGNILGIQEYIESFQVQSATLILNDFPDINNILDFFEVQHTHAWGTLKQLEAGNYKAFCDTTFILFEEFLEHFPQYRSQFPEKYNIVTISEYDR